MKNVKDINRFLKEDARRQKGKLCDEWYYRWNEDGDKQYLIDLFFDGIDFCLKNDWPSLVFIKNNFEKDLLRRNSILADDEYSLLNSKNAILLGKSKSNIRFNGRNSGTIYICSESEANITAKNFSFVIVHVFGKTNVTATTEGEAKITIINHSKSTQIIANGAGIKVKEELNYLA